MSPLPLQLVHVDPTDPPANGDIPVYSSATKLYVPTAGINGNVTAAGTLTSNQVIIGQGTKAVAALGSLGTTTTVLHGNAAGAPTFATVVEADITLADNTTNNVTTSAHGLAPKGTTGTTQFWRQDWTLAAPSGAGNVTTSATLTSGQLIQGNGGTDVTVNATTATVVKLTAGVPSAATAGTDYVVPGSLTGATVATDESTTSGTYANLATTGPSVTITTVGTTAVVWMSGRYYNTTAGQDGSVSVAISGATTLAAADGNAAVSSNTVAGFAVPFVRVVILNGLTPGSNTFTLQYKRSSGTAHFLDRTIAVFAP